MSNGNPQAGAYTTLAVAISRADGQQYLSRISAQLPPGLAGAVDSVAQCPEPQASEGTCRDYSRIGTATVAAGAGPQPLVLAAPAYLTGPYGGGPFGLSIPVDAVAGPFDLGTVVVRAAIGVSPTDAHEVITSDPLPAAIDGIPLRVRSVVIAVDRPMFLFNGTSCSPVSGSGLLTSATGATASLTATPFQLTGCAQLPFSPTISASTDASASATVGADLDVTVSSPPGQANLRSVSLTLPKQVVPRLSTIQQACVEAAYDANPAACPAGSVLGQATARTPILSVPLTGSAYLVSHGPALPTVDLPLSGAGVHVNVVGSVELPTSTSGATTTFGSTATGFLPDVPISSLTVTLPEGSHSLLTPNGALCTGSLDMHAQMTAQSGVQLTRTIGVSVIGCPKASTVRVPARLQVVRKRYAAGRLQVTVRIGATGRVSISGAGLRTTRQIFSRAGEHTLSVGLVGRSLAAVRRHRAVRLKIRVAFVPRARGPGASVETSLSIPRG
jgi:hypothetical protein